MLPLLLAATMAGAHAQDKPVRSDAPSGNPASVAPGTQPGNEADTAPAMVVRVTGLRAVPWKSYRAMRAALAAYEKHKALAPDAIFSFAVLPPVGKTLPPNFKLRMRTKDGQEFPITVENGELFQLPVLPDPEVDGEVVSNVKGGQLRIGLLVHTRSVPPEKERLGDVRLRCEINEAIADVDEARPWRKRRRNFCTSPGATVWHRPRAPTNGALIVEGERREALQTNSDPNLHLYEMPIYGRTWGNDAIIEFDYKKPLRSLKLSEVAVYDAKD